MLQLILFMLMMYGAHSSIVESDGCGMLLPGTAVHVGNMLSLTTCAWGYGTTHCVCRLKKATPAHAQQPWQQGMEVARAEAAAAAEMAAAAPPAGLPHVAAPPAPAGAAPAAAAPPAG